MTRKSVGFFIGRRLAAAIVLLILISFGIFSLLYVAPGNIVQSLLGDRPASPTLIDQLRTQYHLNDPFLTQYWIWLKDALQGNLGSSTSTGQSVISTIESRYPVTLFLGIYAFAITMLVGVSLGVTASVRQRTATDRGVVGIAVMAVSTPAFVTGILLLYLFAVELGWFPVYGPGGGFFNRFVHLTLPAVSLALTQTALVLKITRASMIEILDQDFIVFARARGLSAWRVLVGYALRNALIPVATVSGMIFGYLITGAVLVEVTFALPGLGSLLIDAVNQKDVTTVQGLALVVAATVILMNLITDLVYLALDPRIRFGTSKS